MSESNSQLVARFYEELINRENKAAITEYVDPNVVAHDPMSGTVQGREAFAGLVGLFDRAFPGHRVDVHRLVSEGEYVAVLHTHRGRHTGPFGDVPPTGREFSVTGVELLRVRGGRVVEFWRQDDDAGLLRQLGIIPGPGAPASD